MIPDPEQRKSLQEYLQKILIYRESYDEYYDHILTAISHSNFELSFEKHVVQILNQDLGGVNNLRKAERAFKKDASKRYFKKYRAAVYSFLQLPRLIYILLFSLTVFLIRDSVIMPDINFLWIMMAHFLSLISYWIYRQIKAGTGFRRMKKSVNHDIFYRLLNIPVQIFIFYILLNNFRNISAINTFKKLEIPDFYSSPILTAALTIYLIHSLAILSLLKEEFPAVIHTE